MAPLSGGILHYKAYFGTFPKLCSGSLTTFWGAHSEDPEGLVLYWLGLPFCIDCCVVFPSNDLTPPNSPPHPDNRRASEPVNPAPFTVVDARSPSPKGNQTKQTITAGAIVSVQQIAATLQKDKFQ